MTRKQVILKDNSLTGKLAALDKKMLTVIKRVVLTKFVSEFTNIVTFFFRISIK